MAQHACTPRRLGNSWSPACRHRKRYHMPRPGCATLKKGCRGPQRCTKKRSHPSWATDCSESSAHNARPVSPPRSKPSPAVVHSSARPSLESTKRQPSYIDKSTTSPVSTLNNMSAPAMRATCTAPNGVNDMGANKAAHEQRSELEWLWRGKVCTFVIRATGECTWDVGGPPRRTTQRPTSRPPHSRPTMQALWRRCRWHCAPNLTKTTAAWSV